MRQRLYEAHNSKRLGWLPALAAGCDHLRTGYSFHDCIRILRTNGAYQSGAKHVTGCLTSNQSNSHTGSLARQTALGRAQRFKEEVELGLVLCQFRDLLDGFGFLLAASERNAISVLDVANLVRGKIAPLQAFAVNAARHGRLSRHHGVSGNIAIDACVHAEKSMCSDLAELVHARESTTDYPVPDMYVACQRSVIGHNRFVADHTIMRDVHVGHDPVVIPDNRVTCILRCATTESTELANRVAVANDQACRLPSVLLVLGVIADRGELVDMVVPADLRWAVYDDMAFDTCAATDLDVVSNYRVGANLDIVCNSRAVRHNRC